MDRAVMSDRRSSAAPSEGPAEWTDDELTALALAADPDPVLDADAVPLGSNANGAALVPAWYMPLPRGRVRTRWQVALLVLVVVLLLLINAAGLCNTYGRLVVA